MNDLQKLGLERIIELSKEAEAALISIVLPISRQEVIDVDKKVYPINNTLYKIEEWSRAILTDHQNK